MGKRKTVSPEDLETVQGVIKWWLDKRHVDKTDMLTTEWRLYGSLGYIKDGEKKRQESLKQYIDASINDYKAWENCRKLLDSLIDETHPKDIPDELIKWAMDAATERIQKPKLSRGSHKTDNSFRDEIIYMAIEMCHHSFGLTLEQGKEQASQLVHLDFETVDKIYKEQKRIHAPHQKRVDELMAKADKMHISSDS